MTETVKIISPIDGSVYAERPVASAAEIEAAVTRARAARHAWSEITVGERAKFLGHFLDALLGRNDEILPELAGRSAGRCASAARRKASRNGRGI